MRQSRSKRTSCSGDTRPRQLEARFILHKTIALLMQGLNQRSDRVHGISINVSAGRTASMESVDVSVARHRRNTDFLEKSTVGPG